MSFLNVSWDGAWHTSGGTEFKRGGGTTKKARALADALLLSLGVATLRSQAWKQRVTPVVFLLERQSNKHQGLTPLRTSYISTTTLKVAWKLTLSQSKRGRKGKIGSNLFALWSSWRLPSGPAGDSSWVAPSREHCSKDELILEIANPWINAVKHFLSSWGHSWGRATEVGWRPIWPQWIFGV